MAIHHEQSSKETSLLEVPKKLIVRSFDRIGDRIPKNDGNDVNSPRMVWPIRRGFPQYRRICIWPNKNWR